MKTTRKHPIKITLVYPDGTRLEARLPKWKAWLIMAEIERAEEELKNKIKQKVTNRLGTIHT